MRRIVAFMACIAFLGVTAPPSDPFLWLEDVNGTRAMAWVKAQNARTLGVLKNDPNFAGLYADALKIVEAKDRVPTPELVAHDVYNFWQDASHVRGIWRRTTPADFATRRPKLDDGLRLGCARGERTRQLGLEGCRLRVAARDPLPVLSLGRRRRRDYRARIRHHHEAVRNRRFHAYRAAKQTTAWESDDTLLVSREWSPGELTTSGYPYVVKRLKRGQPLADAVEVFRGAKSDGGYGVTPIVFHDGAGDTATIVARPLSTFKSEYYIVTSQRRAASSACRCNRSRRR